ncbi:MlaD family protein [uncultured Microscilla sp.]|uniref:MlaD family protein n=1 Tax=uncultured Microscilla sp. TaxID=432653 RepID=UPI00260BD15B|nr:MlaD family protein [uncultured Microscilla sp.]
MDKLRSWLVAFMAVVMLIGFVWRINVPDYYKLELHYQQVNFLTTNALIQTRGVAIGRVESVQLTDSLVKVTVDINQDVNIPRGSQFIIKPKGLVGKSMIEVKFAKDKKDYYKPEEAIVGITENAHQFNPAQLEKYLFKGFKGIIGRDDSLLKQLKIMNQRLEQLKK